ncbi:MULTISPECIES: PPOX class F420-dependent oxidoreductase [unclassified Nocardioides]|uniref:PPOX class F420-dependent oxidoreductase n=1 Tax=unclassified Nocardioides TaxID=2615069 RepID=UPI0009F0CCD2|nr:MULTISPECIES: PPOX class F420-dependent oxidoreductase [unclassified Nocardioides]GAW48005.1 Pyridoxamine 5'-phosphate oxidase [Nocardioides sp. PD653-B2]GAW53692.1 Pyridoxamine 5'-phosphate oxidase [Nocardioides sp. PD653]
MWTDAEERFLSTQQLGRLATIGSSGPQIRPVGFRATSETIDIGGSNLSKTQKWRNVESDSRVAFVVDDTGGGPQFAPRGVEVRGHAETVRDAGNNADGGGGDEVIRIRPSKIITWGIESSSFHPISRSV